MTTTPSVARDTLYTVLMLGGVHGRGHTPERSEKASELIDGYRDQVAAETAEDLRVRLWLIEQYVARITADDQAIAIGLDLTPYLDGPLHRGHIDAYRAAQEG